MYVKQNMKGAQKNQIKSKKKETKTNYPQVTISYYWKGSVGQKCFNFQNQIKPKPNLN